METKNNSKSVEKHLSQSVYSLVINYKTCSRFHKHVLLFSITEDRKLLKEVNRFLEYSKSHLLHVYPWLSNMQRTSFEVCLIPSDEYRIASATASHVSFLREQIVVTPYDACLTDFTFAGNESLFCDLPF